VTATSSPLCLLRWAAHTAEGPTLPVHEQQACRAWSLEAAEEVDNRFLWQIHIFEGSNGTAAAAVEGVDNLQLQSSRVLFRDLGQLMQLKKLTFEPSL
jgi:hypothetical protein